jgi:hypothetical protein
MKIPDAIATNVNKVVVGVTTAKSNVKINKITAFIANLIASKRVIVLIRLLVVNRVALVDGKSY